MQFKAQSRLFRLRHHYRQGHATEWNAGEPPLIGHDQAVFARHEVDPALDVVAVIGSDVSIPRRGQMLARARVTVIEALH